MIIGISGKKQSGKDLTARVIQYLEYISKITKSNIRCIEGCVKSLYEFAKFNEKKLILVVSD